MNPALGNIKATSPAPPPQEQGCLRAQILHQMTSVQGWLSPYQPGQIT